MAPTRRAKGMNNRFANFDEVIPVKDVGTSNKPRQRKRKLSDMLGSQWSKGEIQRFYDAYRNFGKDWTKVANAVRNRSTEMVEALYNMNRAYLSLPEGIASVAGLIAMMTDHYNVLEESDNEGEGNKAPGSSQKYKKRARENLRLTPSKDNVVLNHPNASSGGCFSMLNGRPSDGRAVGRRTPRVPISYKKDEAELHAFPERLVKANKYNDDVAHVAALALSQASLRGSSQAWQTSYRLSDNSNISPNQDKERRYARSKNFIDEEYMEDSLGSKGGENGDYVKGSSSSVDVRQTKDTTYRKKYKADDVNKNEFVDSPEACSGTEGNSLSALKDIIDAEMAKGKYVQPTPSKQKKRGKKLLLEDERSAFDALMTLADMSLMMPTSVNEHVNWDKVDPEKSSVGEAVSSSYLEDNTKSRHSGFEVTSSKAFPEEEKLLSKFPDKGSKKKRKLVVSKATAERASNDMPSLSVTGKEDYTDANKPTQQRSRRKNNPQRMWTPQTVRYPKKALSEINQFPQQNEALCSKEKLHALSSNLLRRWCSFEWFYSSIDYPWFAKNDFVDYLHHVGLGHISGLTRVEWCVIRSSLGNPRRFSQQFLNGEKNKLQQYRESVRTLYAELRVGVKDGLPIDLARPLRVGQRVTALHPKTREVHDGKILTVDRDRCRVQFDHMDVGVEFVQDIDCMARNSLGNMPEGLRRHCISANKFPMESKEYKTFGQSNNERFIPFNPTYGPNISTYYSVDTIMNQMKERNFFANTEVKVANTGIVNSQQLSYNVPYYVPVPVPQFRSKVAVMQAIPERSQIYNKQASSEQKNTQTMLSLPPWPKPIAVPSDPVAPTSSIDNSVFVSQDPVSNVHEIVKGSTIKAHAMVDTAVQALSSAKEGEDAFTKIGEALYSMNECQSTSGIRSSEQVNGSANDNELQIPSGLITSTVATLLSIQMCTEREYPPGDVAQVLETAVKSLHPSCPQNLPIYRDIQMCMGKLKTQILALIPT